MERSVHGALAGSRLENCAGTEWFETGLAEIRSAIAFARADQNGWPEKREQEEKNMSSKIPSVPEAAAEEWKLGDFVQSKGVQIAKFSRAGGGPVRFILGKPDGWPVTVPFPPSVFQGTGEEQRKGIAFNLPPELAEQLEALEAKATNMVAERAPTAKTLWNNSVKPAGQYDAKLKAKINVKGGRAANIFDENGERTALPMESWVTQDANAVLELRGAYRQKGSFGLMLEVTHLKVRESSAGAEADTEEGWPEDCFSPRY